MIVYAIVVTALLLTVSIKAMKWKISMLVVVRLCKEKGIEPSDKEISDCTKKVIGKMFKKTESW